MKDKVNKSKQKVNKMIEVKLVCWNVIIKIFGFWNVYYFPQNIKCLFVGHKWGNEEGFEIQPGGYEFGLKTCLRCNCNKWITE